MRSITSVLTRMADMVSDHGPLWYTLTQWCDYGMSVLIFRRSVHVVPSHPRRSSTFIVAPVKTKCSTEAAARFCTGA